MYVYTYLSTSHTHVCVCLYICICIYVYVCIHVCVTRCGKNPLVLLRPWVGTEKVISVVVYLQQNKKGRRPEGKKCHTKTIRGKKSR